MIKLDRSYLALQHLYHERFATVLQNEQHCPIAWPLMSRIGQGCFAPFHRCVFTVSGSSASLSAPSYMQVTLTTGT